MIRKTGPKEATAPESQPQKGAQTSKELQNSAHNVAKLVKSSMLGAGSLPHITKEAPPSIKNKVSGVATNAPSLHPKKTQSLTDS